MKEESTAAVIGIIPDILGSVYINFHRRTQILLDDGGSHIKHVFTDRSFPQVYGANQP
jgi:hypothetical protein